MNEKVLHENKEGISFKEVVRIFLLQSISANDIEDDADLRTLNFVKTILIQKDKTASNPGQIMPIGGNIYEEETPEQAAKREALEETHLIFSDLKKLKAKQKYTFKHHGKVVGREAHFFLGKLFSRRFDVPYALDNKNDKIADFLSFGPDELDQLFKGDDRLLDSLNLDPKVRKEKETVASQTEIQKVQKEVMSELRRAEISKKLNLLNVLGRQGFKQTGTETLFEAVKFFETRFKYVDTSGSTSNLNNLYQNLQDFWKENVLVLCGDAENLKAALRFSNREEIFLDLKIDKSERTKMVPTIHMMLPILFGFNFSKKLEPLLLENPHLNRIYTMTRVLYLYNASLGNLNCKQSEREVKAAKRLLARILKTEKDTPVSKNMVIEFFKENKLLNKDFETSFRELGDEIDHFFGDLQQKSRISPSLAYLSHSNEVEGKNFERILKLAFGFHDEKESSRGAKQIKFEAQRKLLLAVLLYDVKKYYEEIKEQGITELDDLESLLETKDSSPTFGRDGGRKIQLQGETHSVIIERRTKELSSVLRKVLVRDDWSFGETSPYNDVYGESYVFGLDAKDKMEINSHTPPVKMTNSKNETITEYFAPTVVHELICELTSKVVAPDRLGIREWKPLPKEGQIHESNSVGGGGAIRMCKFYLKLIKESGETYTREVQIFLPKTLDGKWVSGKQDYDDKKKDDDRYAIARLFTHGNVYSLIELLFPHDIYGENMKRLWTQAKP